MNQQKQTDSRRRLFSETRHRLRIRPVFIVDFSSLKAATNNSWRFRTPVRILTLGLLTICLLLASSAAQADTFTTVGAFSYSLPVGTTDLVITATGGGGGGGGGDTGNGGSGSNGSKITALIKVPAGATVTGLVGGGGGGGGGGTTTSDPGGSGGGGLQGGNGGSTSSVSGDGGGGGGGSVIKINGDNWIVAAGGGGGGGGSNNFAGTGGHNVPSSLTLTAITCQLAAGSNGQDTPSSSDGGSGGGGGGGTTGGAGGAYGLDGTLSANGGTGGGACVVSDPLMVVRQQFTATGGGGGGAGAVGYVTGGSGAAGSVTISPAPLVTISNTTDASEPATNGAMTVSQTTTSSVDSVIAYTVGGTATAGTDYSALSGTVTIPAGQTSATVVIPVINNLVVDGSRTVVLTLTGVTSGLAALGSTVTATNTIHDNDSATVSIANTSNAAEPATNGTVTVTQTAVSTTDTVLNYSIGGTAHSGTDYAALSGSVKILAGQTTATISIPVINNSIVDGSRTVVLTLTGVASGAATLGTPLTATNTIADNDSASVSISNTSDAAEPAQNGILTLTQTNASATNTVVSYSVGGTASPGGDYTALSGTVTIPAGETTATITVAVKDNLIVDGPRTVAINLTSVTAGAATLGSGLSATNTILDNDSATVSITNGGDATEPSTNGTFTLTQTAVSATNTVVTYSVSGTASAGGDYTTLSGTATILAGQTTTTIPVAVKDNLIVDGSRTVIVNLTGISSGAATLGSAVSATVTIVDDDSASVSIAAVNDAMEPSTNGTFAVTQSAVSTTDTVLSYSITGSAAPNVDYVALSGTVNIKAGDTTATINVAVKDNYVVDGTRSLTLTLMGVTSGTASIGAPVVASISIVDNDTATVSISNIINGEEPATNGEMIVNQTALSTTDSVLTYSVGGTAVAGRDYTALSGTVTVPAGQTSTTIEIPVIDNQIINGERSVVVTLTGVTSGNVTIVGGSVVPNSGLSSVAKVGAGSSATNLIADNDSAEVTIASTSNAAEPSKKGLFTVTQNIQSTTDTVLNYTVSGSAVAAMDYVALSGTVTIPAGATTAAIPVPVIDNQTVDAARTVVVTLTEVTAGTVSIGGQSEATITIADNEAAIVSIRSGRDGQEPATHGSFIVSLRSPSATDTTIAYSASGTATQGQDYKQLSGKLVIPKGKLSATIFVPVNNDQILEGSETVVLTLTSATGATLGNSSSASIEITDSPAFVVRSALTAQSRNFMTRRLDMLAGHSPEIFRLINRQDGRFGVQQSHLDMQITPRGSTGSWQLNSRSLKHALAQPAADAPDTDESAWAFWSEGEFAVYRDSRSDKETKGDFFIGHAGVDYRVSASLLLGVMTEIDVLDEHDVNANGRTKGTGWMIGPYISTEITDQVFLDVRGLYGQSHNRADGTAGGSSYGGDFDTDRWLAEAVLRGNFTKEAWTVTPDMAVSFASENQHAFDVFAPGVGTVVVPKQSAHLGQARLGLKIARDFTEEDWTITPFIGGDLYWDFARTGLVDGNLSQSGEGDLHGAVRLGIEARNDDASIGLQAGYAGIGSNGLKDFSLKMAFQARF